MSKNKEATEKFASIIGKFFVNNFLSIPKFEILIDEHTWIKKDISDIDTYFENKPIKGELHRIHFIQGGVWKEITMINNK